MTLKKTIVVSIVFHICFFFAALLLSARLLEGSGKLPEMGIVFVSLAAEEPRAVKTAGVRAVEKTKEPAVVARVEPETAKADDVVKKAEELSEDVTPEKAMPVAKEPMSKKLAVGVSPLLEEIVDHGKEVEVAQAVYGQPLADNQDVDAAAQGAGILSRTIELISMAIERVKKYPILARKRGIEGTVYVSFNVMADGNPYGIKILKSSGFSILDRATVMVVKKAAPFPFVVNRIELPVAYRLR